MKKRRRLLAWMLVFSMLMTGMPSMALRASAETAGDAVVISALDYGADPTGAADSTVAIQKALAAAKELEAQGKSVTLEFPKGEYHIYKDKAFTREYHTSNTNSIENPVKTIGFLIEEHENLTIDGKGSLFMMHGNMMALAVVKSENIVLRDFAWDFAVPTVTEMTVTATGSNYTEYYIPACFPYQISGNTLRWSSDLSPYTGEPYWTATGNHNTYAIVTYHPDDEMARNMGTDVSPFTNATSITEVGNNVIRINYSYKNGSQNEHHKPGTVFALCGNAHRETAGAFTWESKNVLAEGVNVHFMHGFGWLIQMSEDVTYRNCNLMPRPNSGHITVSFADGLHASGAKGEIVVENCNFANTHDDPINFHGTFTRVERRIDDHTLQLNYIHTQQGGFPQYHVGDQIAFYTRDTLESSDNEKLYTVSKVVSNPGENGNNLRTMIVEFEEVVPEFLTQTVSNGSPKYVAENVTYAPAVTIRNNTFKNTATRGILCTTRQPVVIEGNTFLNMSMATIFLSNDSGDWYESGPIRNMVIRNNEFFIKTIGDTWWDYKSAVYIHPVTYGNGLPSHENPIHKNITIEGNTFHMSDDTVVKAESVENLVIRNNTIIRTDPEFTIALDGTNSLNVGETANLNVEADGMTIIGDNNKNLSDTTSRQFDNVFEFTACKNVVVEGNTYDDGMKNYAVLRNMPEGNLTMNDEEITVVTNASLPADEPVSDLVYVSTNPDVVSVDNTGKMTAKSVGTAEVYAYYVWNGTIVKSNVLTVTAAGESTGSDEAVEIDYEGTLILDSQNPTAKLTASTEVTWSAADFVSNGSTDVITVSADGTVTAQRNGIAWVKASADGSEDKIPVVVNLTVAGSLADDFRFVREDASHYEIADKSIVITQQGGSDLWTYDNTLKNLLLYSNFDRSDLRTVVKVDGLPVRANNNWDTASFLLYKGDDDYISIGKKGHKNGFATVVEQAQSCSEFEEGSTDNNDVTSAYVGFTVNGTAVTMDYKVGDGAWTTAKSADIGFLGDAYEIGFAAWGNGGHDVTFSEFKVGKASETSYDELLNEEPVSLCRSNTAPVIESVTFDAESYQVGDTAAVTYTCTDAEDDELAQPYYLWSWEGGEAVTRTNTFTVTAEGGLSCTVFPVDALGAYGTPAEATVSTTSGDANLELKSLRINGTEVEDGAKVLIPADLQKVELAIASLMPGVGTTTVNGTEVVNDAVLALDAADTITITRSASGMEDVVYTITLVAVESNCTEIQGIEMPELDLSITDLSAITWLVTTTESEATLKVNADDRIGHVEVAYGNYREPVALTNNEAEVFFINGLNSYYITVYAKDGITLEQYNINVVYTPDTTAELKDLKINGKSVENFDSDVYEYLVELEEADTLKVEAVSDQRVRIMIDGEYVMEDAGETSLEVTGISGGSHDIYVVVVADDGIVKNVYHVDAGVPYEQNVELFTFDVGGKSMLELFDENGAATAFVSGNTAAVNIVTKDSGATIKVGGTEVVGSYTGTVDLVDGAGSFQVTITARDGVTTATYTVTLKKVMDPNDSSRDIPVSVLTATAGDWERNGGASEGPAELVLDNNYDTLWHTDWKGTSRANHWIQFELSEEYLVDGLRIKPREGGSTNGIITAYDIQVSDDGVNFRSVASGNWEGSSTWKGADFDAVNAKFVRLVAVDALSDNSYVFASAAEIRLTGLQEQRPVYYTITIGDVENGIVTADKAEAKEGETVTVTAAPAEGYKLSAIYVNDIAIEGNTFVMPAEDVAITAEFVLSNVDEDAVEAARQAAAAAEAAQAAAEEAQRKAETARDAAEEAAANAEIDREAAEKAQQEAEAAQAAAEEAQAAAEEALAAAQEAEKAAAEHDTAAAAAAAEAAKRAQEVAELYKQVAEAKAEMAEYLSQIRDIVSGAEEDRKKAEAAELACAKYYALIRLIEYAEDSKVQGDALDAALNAGIEAINAAETVAAVEEALAAALAAIDAIELPFVDVPADSFYAEPVAWAVELGITNGTSDTSFSPEKVVSRAEAVTFLWRAAGQPEPTATVNPFADVTENDFFYKAVLWAVEKGITNGMTETTFGPLKTANRAQIVTFLWRAMEEPTAEAENPFVDVAEQDFYYDAVLWAVEKGITSGMDTEHFGPAGECNRAQMVTFLYRAYK